MSPEDRLPLGGPGLFAGHPMGQRVRESEVPGALFSVRFGRCLDDRAQWVSIDPRVIRIPGADAPEFWDTVSVNLRLCVVLHISQRWQRSDSLEVQSLNIGRKGFG